MICCSYFHHILSGKNISSCGIQVSTHLYVHIIHRPDPLVFHPASAPHTFIHLGRKKLLVIATLLPMMSSWTSSFNCKPGHEVTELSELKLLWTSEKYGVIRPLKITRLGSDGQPKSKMHLVLFFLFKAESRSYSRPTGTAKGVIQKIVVVWLRRSTGWAWRVKVTWLIFRARL